MKLIVAEVITYPVNPRLALLKQEGSTYNYEQGVIYWTRPNTPKFIPERRRRARSLKTNKRRFVSKEALEKALYQDYKLK